ncbi:MAG: hypothetical protein K0S75_1438 [Clostridia bacterium]|jgi:phage protein D|nr:hypothetical protein [Clostridia bacterium]
MKAIYQGVDITNEIDIIKANIIDNASGIADSIELVASDTKKLWSKWKPLKGDTIALEQGNLKSGIMFVDQLEQISGKFTIKAVSTPLQAKTARSRHWENIRFLELAKDIAGNYGFTVYSYGITDWLYEIVDQIEQPDFHFLHERCILEGYCLKITDSKVVLYDERYLEQQATVKDIYLDDIDIDHEFKTVTVGLYSSCEVQTADGLIKALYRPLSPPSGPILRKNIYVSSQAEAERFASGLLRYTNKLENFGRIQIEQDTGLAAGSNVNLIDIGLLDGKAFAHQVIHKIVNNKTILKLRKPLEGY